MKSPRNPRDNRPSPTVAAIARALLPAGSSLQPGGEDLALASAVAKVIASMPARPRRGMTMALKVLEYAPLLSLHWKPLSKLSPRACEAFIAKCSEIPVLKQALLAAAAFTEIAYFSDQRIAALIGYDGKPLKPISPLPHPVSVACHQYPDLSDRQELDVDLCIIGSGAGGATVARHVAEAGLTVLILEEGGLFTAESFRARPPAERMVRIYRDAGLTATIGRPPVILPMGCAVGGTTVVNSGSCFRTPADVLRAWELSGVAGANPEEMEKYFDKVENNLSVTDVTDDILGSNGEMMRKGADALGLSHGPIPRAARACHGSGQCAFGCPLDAKQAMHVSYLPAAVKAGARILAHCKARKLLLVNGKVTGVEAEIRDPQSGELRGKLRVRARAVVLAAGAIFSPLLLRRSHLRDRGGHLGRHLRIHPGLGVTGIFDQELKAWRGVMQSYHVDDRIADGILLEATYPPPGIGWGASNFPYTGSKHKEILAAGNRMATIGVLISDKSEGSVWRAPAVGHLMRYDMQEQDSRRAIEGVMLACRILFAAGAKRVLPGLPDLPELHSYEEVEQMAVRQRRVDSRLKLSAFHPLGTCRMNDSEDQGVVDSFGQVHDAPGLYIADASVLPGSTVVNPQITLMAFATRTAERVADSLL